MESTSPPSPSPGLPPRPMVEVRGLRKAFGTKEILRGVDLTIQPQEVAVILGPSGSGKSTLLRCVAALEEYQEGEIWVDGERIGYDDSPARRRLPDRVLSRQRANIGMVFQSFNLFPHMRVLDNVTLGLLHVRRMDRDQARDMALYWLDRVGLKDTAQSYPSQLSGGQQQRVAIARAIVMQPKVLLLDEVTSALDPELVGEVLAVVRDLARSGVTMMLVTHEILFARDVAHKIVFLDNGVVVEEGAPEEVLRHPRSERLAAFLRRYAGVAFTAS
jgi:polar amino acid transport system ATP-binding protein